MSDPVQPQHSVITEKGLEMLRCVRPDDHSSLVCPGCAVLTIEEDRRKLAIATEALRFYADEGNFPHSGYLIGGKAREALSKITSPITPDEHGKED